MDQFLINRDKPFQIVFVDLIFDIVVDCSKLVNDSYLVMLFVVSDVEINVRGGRMLLGINMRIMFCLICICSYKESKSIVWNQYFMTSYQPICKDFLIYRTDTTHILKVYHILGRLKGYYIWFRLEMFKIDMVLYMALTRLKKSIYNNIKINVDTRLVLTQPETTDLNWWSEWAPLVSLD